MVQCPRMKEEQFNGLFAEDTNQGISLFGRSTTDAQASQKAQGAVGGGSVSPPLAGEPCASLVEDPTGQEVGAGHAFRAAGWNHRRHSVRSELPDSVALVGESKQAFHRRLE